MTTTTLNAAPAARYARADQGFLARTGAAFVDWMVRAGERSSVAASARKFAALHALSDIELAKRGLTREGLIHHCFDARTGY